MNVTIDSERFDELQLRVLRELVTAIRDGLREAGITEEQALYEATGNLSFAVAAIIDGSRQMDLDGEPVLPFLGFAVERNGEELIAAEGGSWMHEYAFGVVDDVLSADGTE